MSTNLIASSIVRTLVLPPFSLFLVVAVGWILHSARLSARILRQDGVHRILLVTDAMHMPRAKMEFAKTGLDVVAVPTLFFADGSIAPFDFLPSAEGLRRSYYAIYEWIGLIWYWVRNGGSA